MSEPRLDWTEAKFEFNFKLTSVMVLNVGVPTIGGIVGKGNRPQSCSWELAL